MERYCSTGQSPQRAVVATEEEEEEEEEEEAPFIFYLGFMNMSYRRHMQTYACHIGFAGKIYFQLCVPITNAASALQRMYNWLPPPSTTFLHARACVCVTCSGYPRLMFRNVCVTSWCRLGRLSIDIRM